MLGRSEGKPSRIIYNVPFLVWQSPEWLATHQFDLNDKTARPFSNMDFIYAWSDLAGLNYTGFEPEKSLFNEAFKPQPRYIGDPDNKSSLMLYDDLKQ